MLVISIIEDRNHITFVEPKNFATVPIMIRLIQDSQQKNKKVPQLNLIPYIRVQ